MNVIRSFDRILKMWMISKKKRKPRRKRTTIRNESLCSVRMFRPREVVTIFPRKFSVMETLETPGTLLVLVRGQLERNEMLPRKLDCTGTNAHTSIGAHRESGCTNRYSCRPSADCGQGRRVFRCCWPEVDSIIGTIKTFRNVW